MKNIYKPLIYVALALFIVACGGGSSSSNTSNNPNSDSSTPPSSVDDGDPSSKKPVVPVNPEPDTDPKDEKNETPQSVQTHGNVKSTTITLPRSLQTSCDKPQAIRMMGYFQEQKNVRVPNAMYHATCTTSSGEQKMFTSLTVNSNSKDRGMIVEYKLENGQMKGTGVFREFTECSEMHGIATSKDCSVVGALCRRSKANSKSGFTKDLLDVDYIPQMWNDLWSQPIKATDSPELKARKESFDIEWIYEWKGGDITKNPKKYIFNKAIGGWEYGRQDLIYGNEQDSYGAYMKTAWGKHENDTFMVLDRTEDGLRINNVRGWKSSCAAGHTIFNHAAFNPNGLTEAKIRTGMHDKKGRYAGICGTDYGIGGKAGKGYGGLWVSVEKPGHLNGTEQGFLSIPHSGNTYIGGVSSMLPLSDGGYLAVVSGVENPPSSSYDYQNTGKATSIALVRFDQNGVKKSIKWIVKDNTNKWFYSYPQIADLGNGRYLFGYARMTNRDHKEKLGNFYSESFRLPSSFYMYEIDINGKALTKEQSVEHGWSDQDRMVSIASGKVAWAYIPDSAYKTEKDGANASLPNCQSEKLLVNLYTSPLN